MTITYTWLIKHLNVDNRGYVNTGVFEMEGVDENGNKEIGSVTVCFGADEIKPMSQWTQEDIDSYAETKRSMIEENIIQALTDRITALETK